jgi:hypothetical protein
MFAIEHLGQQAGRISEQDGEFRLGHGATADGHHRFLEFQQIARLLASGHYGDRAGGPVAGRHGGQVGFGCDVHNSCFT